MPGGFCFGCWCGPHPALLQAHISTPNDSPEDGEFSMHVRSKCCSGAAAAGLPPGSPGTTTACFRGGELLCSSAARCGVERRSWNSMHAPFPNSVGAEHAVARPQSFLRYSSLIRLSGGLRQVFPTAWKHSSPNPSRTASKDPMRPALLDPTQRILQLLPSSPIDHKMK